MSEPMPTKAQYEYMAKADAIEQHAMTRWGSGIFWFMWAMGHTNTGRACLRRGWIDRYLPQAHGPYQLTASGRAALARYREEVGDAD